MIMKFLFVSVCLSPTYYSRGLCKRAESTDGEQGIRERMAVIFIRGRDGSV